MVRLRLQRHGAKKRPFYRLVAADKRSPRDGRFIELLGTYDPLQEPPVLRVNRERLNYWVGVGASASETVAALIKKVEKGEGIDLSAEGAERDAKKARIEARKEGVEARRAEARKASEAAAKAAAEAPKAEEAPAAPEAEAAPAEEAPAETAEATEAPTEE